MEINDIKQYMINKHDGQKRSQGTPYYFHPLAVYELVKEMGYGLDYQITALFHDLLEDTDASEEEMLAYSNSNVLESVKLLTKEENYVMEEYINRIKNNEIAIVVKLADRIHNLSEAHLASPKFMNRYIIETKKWYVDLARNTKFESKLTNVLNELENKYNSL